MKNRNYIYSSNSDNLNALLSEVPIQKRHLFVLIEDKNHLFRVACQSTLVVNDPCLVTSLYELGANHVFVGKGFWKELKELSNSSSESLNLVDYDFPQLVSHSHSREYVRSALLNIKGQQLPLLITGESGTGKTLLAKKLHESSLQKSVFISKNLSEISSTLFESELFGHIKGAFTGATGDKKGLFERVNGGTLFLDEIATLTLEQQAILLKVIEEKKFSPVGSSKVIRVEFQLITATCENLEELIKQKKFRFDFFNRIAGLELELPPLRDLREHIPSILERLQSDKARKLHFTPECLQELKSYTWPGNVRELKTWLEKAYLGQRSVIHNANLQLDPHPNKQITEFNHSQGLPGVIQELENKMFAESYEKNRGRPNKICEDLMISKSVFYRLLKEHPSSRMERLTS